MTVLRILLAAALVTLAACGEAEQATTEIPPLDVAAVAANTSPSQREPLADGVITFAGYEKATLATVQCLRDAGMSVEGPHPRNGTDSRYLDFTFGMVSDTGESLSPQNDKAVSTADRCETTHRSDIARVWEFQLLLSPEARKEQKGLLIGLRQAGVDLQSDAPHQECTRFRESVSRARRGCSSC
jgi:hypothetical protein